MSLVHVKRDEALYPRGLRSFLGEEAPQRLTLIGNPDILNSKAMALFCSVKCPGTAILQTYDLARTLRDHGIAVIGGFHSPMERECLDILLRGKQPVVVCPARTLLARIRPEWRKPLEEGRLLLLSAFPEKDRRITEVTSLARNRFVAALAEVILFAYAEPGGKTESFCREVLTWGKRVFVLDDPANANLLALGAKAASPQTVLVG